MPRTREFDLQEALDRAMTVFWNKGYEATSIQNLVDHMGVQRGSLYAAFGDKHNLFVEALRHYAQTVMTRYLVLLQDPNAGLGCIYQFFDELVETSINDSDAKGCFLTNTVAELAASDEVVAAELKESIGAVEQALLTVLTSAQERGELAAERDPARLAQYLVSSINGLRVMAKLNRDPKQLDAIKETVLSVLK